MEKISNYTLLKRIGGGNYGTVYLSRNNRQEVFAIKKIEVPSRNKKLRSLLESETATLNSIYNPSIVNLKESFNTKTHIYLVMEYCEGGDLEKFLEKNEKVPIHIVKKWMRQLFQGLSDMRKQNIVHRDIKPANIMLTKVDPELADIKLGDFGFAKFLGDSLTCTQLGTPLYMAPEIFESSYTYKIDIWSLGLVIYEMLYGHHLFDCYRLEELKALHKKPIVLEDDDNVSAQAKDLIRAMLTYEYLNRPDYEELLKMEFFDDISDQYEIIEKPDEPEENKPRIPEIKKKISEEIKQKISEEIKQKIPEEIKQKIPEEIKQKIPEEIKQKIPEEIKQDLNNFEEPFENSYLNPQLPEISLERSVSVNSNKEIQSFCLSISNNLKMMENCFEIIKDRLKTSEVLYCVNKFISDNFGIIFNKLNEFRLTHGSEANVITDLLEEYTKTQEDYVPILITIQKKIEGVPKIDNLHEILQNHILNESLDLTHSNDDKKKRQGNLLLKIGYFLFPDNEIILQSLYEDNAFNL
jgi:serine/threonine protein kinase